MAAVAALAGGAVVAMMEAAGALVGLGAGGYSTGTTCAHRANNTKQMARTMTDLRSITVEKENQGEERSGAGGVQPGTGSWPKPDHG